MATPRLAKRFSGPEFRRSHLRSASNTTGSATEIWSSLLDTVSSTKQFPTKSLLLLGGSPDSQRSFINSVSTTPKSGIGITAGGIKLKTNAGIGNAAGANAVGEGISQNVGTSGQPIANNLALGYTYIDVLDADQDDDVLARLSIHTLIEPDPAFVQLLRPLLTPKTLSNMLIVILLDWHRPWSWMRELRSWIRLLRALMVGLSEEAKAVLEENIERWRDCRQNFTLGQDGATAGSDLAHGVQPELVPGASASVLLPAGSGAASAPSFSLPRPTFHSSDVKIPLGPGEWDSPLGLPLCVVAQHAERIEHFERTRGWHEEEFDFILQMLRTILLKHGAGLVYTIDLDSARGALPMRELVHDMLNIRSLDSKEQIRHNVIDRDQVLVPPNWDSWGKIRVLREGFDVERVSERWEVEIEKPARLRESEDGTGGNSTSPDAAPDGDEGAYDGVVSMYERVIVPPQSWSDSISRHGYGQTTDSSETQQHHHAPGLEVHPTDNQVFLESQLKVLQQLVAEDEKERQTNKGLSSVGSSTGRASLPPGFGLSSGVGGPGGSAVLGSGPSGMRVGSSGSGMDANKIVEHQIGPVQFNMGGIQVDADDVLRKLREREATRASEEQQLLFSSTASSNSPSLSSSFLRSANSTSASSATAVLANPSASATGSYRQVSTSGSTAAPSPTSATASALSGQAQPQHPLSKRTYGIITGTGAGSGAGDVLDDDPTEAGRYDPDYHHVDEAKYDDGGVKSGTGRILSSRIPAGGEKTTEELATFFTKLGRKTGTGSGTAGSAASSGTG